MIIIQFCLKPNVSDDTKIKICGFIAYFHQLSLDSEIKHAKPPFHCLKNVF